MENNATLDIFLKKLLVAPKSRQAEAIQSALLLLDGNGKPPADQIFYNGKQAAKICGITYQSLWRLCKTGTIKAVHIEGLNRPRYARKDLLALAGGKGDQS